MKSEGNKVFVSKSEVASFNRTFPESLLRDTRSYWFEFDSQRQLVDTDVPQQDDCPAAGVLSEICREYLFYDVSPSWAINEELLEPKAQEASMVDQAIILFEASAETHQMQLQRCAVEDEERYRNLRDLAKGITNLLMEYKETCDAK